jgi:hypothetical protein
MPLFSSIKRAAMKFSSIIQIGYESIVPMRNDVGTLQHFLLLVKFHQKDKLEIKNLEMQ